MCIGDFCIKKSLGIKNFSKIERNTLTGERLKRVSLSIKSDRKKFITSHTCII